MLTIQPTSGYSSPGLIAAETYASALETATLEATALKDATLMSELPPPPPGANGFGTFAPPGATAAAQTNGLNSLESILQAALMNSLTGTL